MPTHFIYLPTLSPSIPMIFKQDANLQIDQLGWDNPEVTFEAISCQGLGYPDWASNCQCASPWSVTPDLMVPANFTEYVSPARRGQ